MSEILQNPALLVLVVVVGLMFLASGIRRARKIGTRRGTRWLVDQGYLPPTPVRVMQDQAEEAQQAEIRKWSSFSD